MPSSPFDSTRAANAISARAAFVFNVYLVIQAKEANHVVHVPASNGAGIDLTCPLRCEDLVRYVLDTLPLSLDRKKHCSFWLHHLLPIGC